MGFARGSGGICWTTVECYEIVYYANTHVCHFHINPQFWMLITMIFLIILVILAKIIFYLKQRQFSRTSQNPRMETRKGYSNTDCLWFV